MFLFQIFLGVYKESEKCILKIKSWDGKWFPCVCVISVSHHLESDSWPQNFKWRKKSISPVNLGLPNMVTLTCRRLVGEKLCWGWEMYPGFLLICFGRWDGCFNFVLEMFWRCVVEELANMANFVWWIQHDTTLVVFWNISSDACNFSLESPGIEALKFLSPKVKTGGRNCTPWKNSRHGTGTPLKFNMETWFSQPEEEIPFLKTNHS